MAHAQDAASGADQLEEITVTGSRIKRSTDFDTPNPTTVVDSAYMEKLGIVNVGDMVKQLPANLSNNTPRTTGNANFFIGSTIANLRGLNPYFGSRTLTMVDNRRFVPTNQGDGVDLNFIPSVLIDHVDIVTGGASAAYGSGAIAGVQNIFLNRRLEGGKAQIDYGKTGEGDGAEKHVGLAFGSSVFDGRGHFVVGYEYQDSDAVGCINARDWCRKGNGFYNTTPGTPANTIPQFTLGRDVRANQISTTGVFFRNAAGLTQTLQADAAGTGTSAFNLGTGNYASSAQNVVSGGDGRPAYLYTNLSTPVERNVGSAMFTFAITDSLNLNVDASYGKVESTNVTGAQDSFNQRVYGDNAFLSTAALRSAYTASLDPRPDGTYALVSKDWTAQTNPHTDFDTDVKRIVIGLDGKFGESSWSWDAYYQYGKTKREQYVADARRQSAYLMATDAVIDNRAGSSTFGQAVRRVTRDGYAAASALNRSYANLTPDVAAAISAGCVPLNTFGTGHDVGGGQGVRLRLPRRETRLRAAGRCGQRLGRSPHQRLRPGCRPDPGRHRYRVPHREG